MLQCVPYIKSICHHVWMTDCQNHQQNAIKRRDAKIRKANIDSFEVTVFGPQVNNTSLCVVDNLIADVNHDPYDSLEITQPESSDVIVQKEILGRTSLPLKGSNESGEEDNETFVDLINKSR